MTATGTLDDYRVARHAQELRMEAACGTRDTASEEALRFYAQTGASDLGGETPFTWNQWLRQTRIPEPDRPEVERVLVTLVQDADAQVRAALEAYEAAVAVRDMQLADASEFGLSYRELGRLTGVSQTIVGKCVNRAKEARA